MGFSSPVDLALGPDGVAYVANRGSESISNVPWYRTGVGQRISRLTTGLKAGEEQYLGEFSRYGHNEGQLIWPTGITTDNQGNLYVTDEWLNRISIFDKEGDFLRCWSTIQSVDREPNGASGIAIDASGREHNQTDRADIRISFDRMGQRYPIHIGHVPIQESDVVGFAPCCGRVEHLQGLGAIAGTAIAHTPGDHLMVQDLAIGVVIVHNEHAQTTQVRGHGQCRCRRARLSGQTYRKPEGRANPQFTLDADGAPHHANELFHNGQAQTRAPIFTRRRPIGL